MNLKTVCYKTILCLTKIIKKRDFNDDYPENKNIRLVNKKDYKLQILNDGK